MTDLGKFLQARFDEEEATCAPVEIGIKRRIAKLHERLPEGEFCVTCDAPAGIPGRPQGCGTLRLLALPYASHPNYRQEWKP